MFSKMFLAELLAILAGAILMALPKWSPIRAGLRYFFHIFAKKCSKEKNKEAGTMKHKWSREKIELLKRLDRATLDEFFDDYGELILTWCLYLMEKNEEKAWDLFQSVSWEILKSLPTLRESSKLNSFLYIIVRRTWIKCIRGKKREERANKAWIEIRSRKEITGPDALLCAKDIWLLLVHLTTLEREAILLHYLKELSIQETAQKLGISVESVRVHLHNGRRKLRGFLE